MLATIQKRTLIWPPKGTILPRAVILLLVCLLAGSEQALHAGEALCPQALLNWMIEGTFHALIVDKSQQRLTVWRIKDGEPSMIESYRCATGENQGDKWVRGDMRTPEGVYFFCSLIDGQTLPTKYGLWAFTTDYPNFVDRRRGKSGDGIWLHGRDKPLGDRPDSNGCIALENQDLGKVSRFVRLQNTPLIVVNKLIMAPRAAVMEQEQAIRDFIESWRQAWESRDLERYMGHYSPNFQSCWFDVRGWREKKRRLIQRYRRITVRLDNVYIYRQDGIVTCIFSQTYTSDGFRSSGIKVMYLTESAGRYTIYAEDYHQPVDDPFPVGTLLARAGGGESKPVVDENPSFRIRLVSTDEPDQAAMAETEAPQPSAPSRGVVLDRLADRRETAIQAPALESNGRIITESTPDRLIVARLMPSYALTDSLQTAKIPARIPKESDVVVGSAPRPTEIASEERAPFQGGLGLATSLKPPHEAPKKPDLQSQALAVGSPPGASCEVPKQDRRAGEQQEVLAFLEQWKRCWEQKDLDRFIKMYHPNFQGEGMDYEVFLKSKRNFFRKYRTIRVEMDRVKIRKENGKLLVKFLQSFQGDDYRDKGWKSMVLAGGKGDGLRIVQEHWAPAQGRTAHSGTQSP